MNITRTPAAPTLAPRHLKLRHFVGPFFFLYGGIGVTFPFLMLYMRDAGLSTSQIALVSAMFAAATICWSQVWGYVADMWISPRRLLVLNASLSSALFLCLPFMNGLLSFCLLMFAVTSFSSPLWQLLNSLLLCHERGERNFSAIRSIGSISFIFVNLATGLLCTRHGTAVLFPIFALIQSLFLVSILAVPEIPQAKGPFPKPAASTGQTTGPVPQPVEVLPDGEPEGLMSDSHSSCAAAPASEEMPGRRLTFWQAQKVFFHQPAVVIFLLFIFFYQMGHQVSHAFQGLWIRDLGGSDTLVGMAFSLAATCEVIVFWTVDRMLSGRSAVPFLQFAALVQLLRWMLVWMFPSLWLVVASNALHAITFGLLFAASVVYMHRLSPPHLRTTGQTTFALSYFGFAALAGNLLGSGVMEWLGLRSWYGFAAGIAALAALLACFIPRADHPANRSSQGHPA